MQPTEEQIKTFFALLFAQTMQYGKYCTVIKTRKKRTDRQKMIAKLEDTK